MSDAGLIDVFAALRSRLAHTAAQTLRACSLGADEQLLILTDSATAPELTRAFTDVATALGHAGDVVLLSVSPRRPAFADLPPLVVDALLAADLVIDLTTVPWLYSDSFTRYGQQCRARGSRLALIWGMPESLRTVAACPPSATLADRARRALHRLNRARTLRIRSTGDRLPRGARRSTRLPAIVHRRATNQPGDDQCSALCVSHGSLRSGDCARDARICRSRALSRAGEFPDPI